MTIISSNCVSYRQAKLGMITTTCKRMKWSDMRLGTTTLIKHFACNLGTSKWDQAPRLQTWLHLHKLTGFPHLRQREALTRDSPKNWRKGAWTSFYPHSLVSCVIPASSLEMLCYNYAVHDSDESRRHYTKKSESWSRAPSSKIEKSEGKQTAQRRGCRWTLLIQ